MRDHLLVGPVLFLGIAALSLLGGCSGGTPSGPDLEAAGGDESDPVVSSAEPRLVPPNVTLDLRVFGSGFDEGSRVDVATDGVPSPKVRTDLTRFVRKGEVVATITTAADVPLGPYDIVLTDTKGKQGVGTELIDVDSTSGIQVNTSTTSTTGTEPRGGFNIVYAILIDGASSGGHPVNANGSATVTGMSAGEHTIELDEVAEGCAVSGDNPRRVNVLRGEIVQVLFVIACTSTPSADVDSTSGIVTNEAGEPLAGANVELDCCGPPEHPLWQLTTTDASGRYVFERAVGGAVMYSWLDDYVPNVQLWQPDLNFRLRRERTVTAGQSFSVSIELDSSMCSDLEDWWVLTHRCESVTIVPERDGTLVVDARDDATGRTVPLVFFATSGFYTSVQTVGKGVVSVGVHAGERYHVFVGVPGAATPQRYELSTAVR
jgi:hypothetical protein